MKSPINFLSPNPLKRIVDVGTLFMIKNRRTKERKTKPNCSRQCFSTNQPRRQQIKMSE